MSIINQESSTFEPIIGTEDFIQSTPNLSVNPSVSVISNVVDMLQHKIEMACDLEKREITPSAIIEMYSKMKKDPTNSVLFDKLDDVANQLGSNITGVFNTIQYSVKPTVDKLHSDITNMVTRIMSEDEVVDEEGKSTVEVVDDDPSETIENLGGAEEVEECFKSNTKMNGGFSSVVRLYLDRKFAVENITDTEVGDDVLKEGIKNVETESNVEEEAATEAWNLISNNYNLKQFMFELCADSAKNGNYYKCVSNMKHAVKVIKPAVLAWRKTFLNVTDKVNEKVQRNIDNVLSVIEAGAYTLNIINKLYDKHSTIVMKVDGNKVVVNRNNMRANMLTDEDVTKHLRIKYFSKNRTVPSLGINAKEIVSNKDKVAKEFEEDTNMLHARLIQNRRSATVKAMRSVLSSYLENTDPTKLPAGVNGTVFARQNSPIIDKYANRLEANSDRNLQSSLFDFVIEMWHRNTPVAKAHSLFGKEVVKQLELEPALEDMHIKMIDTVVAASIASDFIVEKLCVIDK